MELSREQDSALKAVDKWLRNNDSQLFRLFGYAGTGKTTLAKHFAEGVSNVMFGAFTGKAAYVLRQKGCGNASTIHSMIYLPKEKSKKALNEIQSKLISRRVELSKEEMSEEDINNDTEIKQLLLAIEKESKAGPKGPMFTLNLESQVRGASLVIIDECSMVNKEMAEDLMSFGTKILVLGDPAQLPPVYGTGFFTNHKPDVMLSEIHRQAKESPIIAMATKVRKGESLPVGSYGDSEVLTTPIPEDGLAADQILVGRNKTRLKYNRKMRKLLGRSGTFPVKEDKVVCLRNNHDEGLLNGGLWEVLDSRSDSDSEEKVFLKIKDYENGGSLDVMAHSQIFEGKRDDIDHWDLKEAEEFDYGYALTVHKAQGSQWDNVLLFDESSCFKKDRYKWLYTGLTRAAEKVKVVLR